jgi:hypothetical protein
MQHLLDDMAVITCAWRVNRAGDVVQHGVVDRLDIRFPDAASPQSSNKFRQFGVWV